MLDRAGVRACPNRVAAVYLELAVLVRALEGLATAASLDAPPDRSSLWAGLFDLQDTLLGSRSTTCARSPPRGGYLAYGASRSSSATSRFGATIR